MAPIPIFGGFEPWLKKYWCLSHNNMDNDDDLNQLTMVDNLERICPSFSVYFTHYM